MKKLLSIFLVLCLALSLLPAAALAADVVDSGVGADGIRWSFSRDGVLTVTGSGSMRNYDKSEIYMDENIDQRVPAPWAKYAASLKTIVIGEGITEVGDFTFIDCRSVTRIQLPGTLRRVGQNAFSSASVTELTLPEGLQQIDRMAFAAVNITELVIPASVTELGEHAFDGCDSLRVLKILGPVRSIEAGTFRHCTSLNDLFLSGGIGRIDHNAFLDCPSIQNVYFGGSREQWKTLTGDVYSEFNHGRIAFHFNADLAPSASFTDVPVGSWYAESVHWAAQRGVTAGTAPGRFSPDDPCTRAQMVTFLWRAMGNPSPDTPVKNAFRDVKDGDYFREAVLWAIDRGITRGTSETTFSPDDTVTRAQTVTFLWRLHSEVTETTRHSFSDVPADAYYHLAVCWAENSGVTSGVAPGVFGPDQPCTRAQIVTFLYRSNP